MDAEQIPVYACGGGRRPGGAYIRVRGGALVCGMCGSCGSGW
jgi:hypothetical protein